MHRIAQDFYARSRAPVLGKIRHQPPFGHSCRPAAVWPRAYAALLAARMLLILRSRNSLSAIALLCSVSWAL
jgi:hypothetical protein